MFQELNKDDYDQRLVFCDIMMNYICTEKYEALLPKHVILNIQNFVGPNFQNICFQQGGAPPPTSFESSGTSNFKCIFPVDWLKGCNKMASEITRLVTSELLSVGPLKKFVNRNKPQDTNDLQNTYNSRSSKKYHKGILNNTVSNSTLIIILQPTGTLSNNR